MSAMLTGPSLQGVGRGSPGTFALLTTSDCKPRLVAEESLPFSLESSFHRDANQLSVGDFGLSSRHQSNVCVNCRLRFAVSDTTPQTGRRGNSSAACARAALRKESPGRLWSLAGGTRAWKKRPRTFRAEGTRAGSVSPGDPSSEDDGSPGEENKRPLLKVHLPGPSGASLALSACTASLVLFVCAFFPGTKPAAVTLFEAIINQVMVSAGAFFMARQTLVAFEEDSRMSGQVLNRDPGLPSDWHKLLDPKTNRVYYYNSISKTVQWDPPPSSLVTKDSPGASPGLFGTLTLFSSGLFQQLGGILQALVTVGLYLSLFATRGWCACAVYGEATRCGDEFLPHRGFPRAPPTAAVCRPCTCFVAFFPWGISGRPVRISPLRCPCHQPSPRALLLPRNNPPGCRSAPA